jgi:multicomponent Na+:H+ antiporter subunit E
MRVRIETMRLGFILKLVRLFMLSLLGLGTWLILSGDFSTVSLIAGGVFALLCALFLFRVFFEKKVMERSDVFIRFDLLLLYFILLLIQSYRSTFQIIRMLFSGNYSPGIVRVKTRLRTSTGKTMLANTITLIPGTLSLWMEGQYIFVHMFHRHTWNNLKAGREIKGGFENLLMRIFG